MLVVVVTRLGVGRLPLVTAVVVDNVGVAVLPCESFCLCRGDVRGGVEP